MGKFENNTEKKGGFPLWILLVVAVAAIAIVLAVTLTGGNNDDTDSGSDTSLSQQTEASSDAQEDTQSEDTDIAQSQTTETVAEPVLEILSSEEVGEYVFVTTSYGTFRYAFAFSDLVNIQTVTEGESETLMFYIMIGDTGAKLFTIRFDDTGAIKLGSVTVSDGTVRSVTADVYSAPDSLDADGRNTYYAAQETFNDVVSSLQENANFISEN